MHHVTSFGLQVRVDDNGWSWRSPLDCPDVNVVFVYLIWGLILAEMS